jgi:hypothetical protein
MTCLLFVAGWVGCDEEDDMVEDGGRGGGGRGGKEINAAGEADTWLVPIIC